LVNCLVRFDVIFILWLYPVGALNVLNTFFPVNSVEYTALSRFPITCWPIHFRGDGDFSEHLIPIFISSVGHLPATEK
jgi:hypothetical protein